MSIFTSPLFLFVASTPFVEAATRYLKNKEREAKVAQSERSRARWAQYNLTAAEEAYIPVVWERIQTVCPWAFPDHDDQLQAQVLKGLTKFYASVSTIPIEKVPNEEFEQVVINEGKFRRRMRREGLETPLKV